ncbi:MAG TPA: asparagine synthase (glutamine-hydrolyzing) [Nitrospiria bacterium]|nr:asparagine synthase (glutamine-hydrolyzing) [Nitrospiria bacterium]
MCGIYGIYDIEGRGNGLDPVLREMGNSLSHRGPDDEGIYLSSRFKVPGSKWTPTVALGHRRLSIIDLDGGHQPMTNEDGSVVIVFNGEIYNFKELRGRLIKKGHRFKTESDTEVILHQYEEDGWRCVEQFNGIFAFSLWDENKASLLLARDRMGVKPLYYTWEDKRLVFASEIRPILLALNKMPEIDRSSLFMLMAIQFIPSPGSIFKGIEKLQPGSAMICCQDRHYIENYYKPSCLLPSERSSQIDNASDQLTSLLKDAVEGQLVSDVPVGAFLSGGVDSSAIVGLMSRSIPGKIKTFSVGFEGEGQHSELGFARLVAKYFDTDHHEISIGPRDVPDMMPKVISYLDDPIVDPAILPTYMVSRLASSKVKVVLTGEGADELFGGYQRYRLDRISLYYQFLPESIRKGVIERLGRRFLDRRYMQGLSAISNPVHSLRHIGWISILSHEELAGLFGGYISAVEEFEKIAGYFEQFFSDCSDDPVGAMLAADISTWLPDDLLIKVDRMSMANSIEARVPYLDRRIVDFAIKIPTSLKIKGRSGKDILKKALSGILPEEILRRPKKGFAPPIGEWFRGKLREYIMDSLSRKAVESFGLFDFKFIDTMIKRHMYGEDFSLPLWGIMTLLLWNDNLKGRRRSLC